MLWTDKAQWVVPLCKVWHRIYSFWENPNFKVLNKPWHLTDQKHVNYLPRTHTRFSQIITCMILLMYDTTVQCKNYSWQESKMYNLQFIFLTHLWPWNKAKVIKQSMKMLTRSKVNINMQSLKNVALTASKKQAMFFFQLRKYLNYLLWTDAQVKNSGIFMTYLASSIIIQSFSFIR